MLMISGHCARRENHRARRRLVSRTIHKISHRARVSTRSPLPSIASRSAPPPSRSDSGARSRLRVILHTHRHRRVHRANLRVLIRVRHHSSRALRHRLRSRRARSSVPSLSRHRHRHHSRIIATRARARSSFDAPRTRARAPSPVSLCSRFVSRIVSRSSPRRASRLHGKSSEVIFFHLVHMGALSRDDPGRDAGRSPGRRSSAETGSREEWTKRWYYCDGCGGGGTVRNGASRGVDVDAKRITRRRARTLRADVGERAVAELGFGEEGGDEGANVDDGEPEPG